MNGGSADRRLAFEATLMTSTTTLRRGMKDPRSGVGHRLSGMREAGVVRDQMSVGAALESVSKWMLAHYRSEGVYKNIIANRLLLERHGWNHATLLSEFKVGGSIADCVIVNGKATAYEIKTELDSPARLRQQLASYLRVFRAVTVVTHKTLAPAYLDFLKGEPVGLMTLDDAGTLRVRRRAVIHEDQLCVETMMKSLRKAEYTHIAEQIAGRQIAVPPTQHFKRCMEIALRVSPVDYCRLFEDELRKRTPRERDAISSESFRYVRHQFIKINPSSKQMANATEWMTRRA